MFIQKNRGCANTKQTPGVQPWIARRTMLVLLAVGILVGSPIAACNAPSALPAAAMSQSGQMVALSLQESPRPTLILAGPNATATPTPFQPLPPTPLFGVTATPLSPAPVVETPAPALAATLPIIAQATLPEPTLTPTATVVEPSPTPTAVPPSPAPITPPPEFAQLPSQINILLLGADRRPWDRQFRTDTIMLVTLNSTEGSVNILSFPRDLYVTIPGYGSGRINTAWTFGGYPLLRQTFKQNWGVQIDYYALIEFSAFKRVIDGLGGLTVNVGEAVSDYRAGYWITIPKGAQVMDADDVLWYVRTRKTTNDIARNRRQQEVLQAIFEKLVSMDALGRAPDFYEVYKNTVTTDIGLLDVLKWLPVGVKVAESGNVKHFFLTYNHVYDWITPEGAMVLVPQHEAVMNMIRKTQNLK